LENNGVAFLAAHSGNSTENCNLAFLRGKAILRASTSALTNQKGTTLSALLNKTRAATVNWHAQGRKVHEARPNAPKKIARNTRMSRTPLRRAGVGTAYGNPRKSQISQGVVMRRDDICIFVNPAKPTATDLDCSATWADSRRQSTKIGACD
jgi:hypothetical protein